MSKEITTLSRREFLKGMLGGSAGALALLYTPDGLAWLMGEPLQEEEQEVPYPDGGWLETMVPDRAAFIKIDGGHQDYLRDMCLKNSVLRSALKPLYDDLLYLPRSSPPLLGDVFRQHLMNAETTLIAHANTLLAGVEVQHAPSLENIVHVALFTMAAIYSPYLTRSDVQEILEKSDLQIPEAQKGSLWIDYDGYRVPRIFPVDIKECGSAADQILRCGGMDKTVHLIQHLFLKYQYFYALRYGLQEKDRVTRLARFISKIGWSNEAKATILDTLGQFAWEFLESIDQIRSDATTDENGDLIDTGFFDPFVWQDFRANMVGAHYADELTRHTLAWDTIDKIVNEMNALTNASDVPHAGDDDTSIISIDEIPLFSAVYAGQNAYA
ncbi:hypothetical protein HY409_02490 [Candidatus Gottesmanbacteria bacterium]|nr:hypothetical protein [Candidatus Gottesmanbacteria bacterium]